MVVDLKVKKSPSYQVASITRVGDYVDDVLKPEFAQLEKWAKSKKIPTGRYIFNFLTEYGSVPDDKRKWEACIEVKGKAKSEGKIKVKTLPPLTSVGVSFDPEQVAERLVYHGLYGWLDDHKKEYKLLGSSREIYPGNPYTSEAAWRKCEVQVVVEKKSGSKK